MPAGEESLEVLRRLGIIGEGWNIYPEIKKELIRSQCCRKSYLRGAFLGGGSVSSPDGNYHLEIITNHPRQAASLASLINRFPGMQAKVSSRKQWYVVYLKDSDQIASFLALIGAHTSLLEFENVRVMKGIKNQGVYKRQINQPIAALPPCCPGKRRRQGVSCRAANEGVELPVDKTERKIAKIDRTARRFTARALRDTGLGLSEYEFIHCVRHHPGICLLYTSRCV